MACETSQLVPLQSLQEIDRYMRESSAGGRRRRSVTQLKSFVFVVLRGVAKALHAS